VAGRCLSATLEGQASARVSATCMAMGEAAGVAAALAAARLDGEVQRIDFTDLRARLEERGVLL